MPDERKDTAPKAMVAETPAKVEETAEENACCQVLERLEIEAPEILSALPREQREKLLHIVTAQLVMKSHRGPLPPPEDIALYNQHIPNGADRIMSMAEKQSEHRREMERTIVTSQTSQSGRGQIFGLLIGLFGITAGAIVALMGHDWVGGGIAGTTVVSLVYAFITGQRAQRPPRDKAQSPSVRQ